MFRLNDWTVVDATMAGGPARYINHSCNPNCVTEVINMEKGDKIVIIANRRINAGEEVRTAVFKLIPHSFVVRNAFVMRGVVDQLYSLVI